MKNHLGQLKCQDLEKNIQEGNVTSPQTLTLPWKSTGGEKTEEGKYSFLFCCWTLWCIHSLCPDSGTTVFKSSVNPGVSASTSTLKRTPPALECSKKSESLGKSNREKAHVQGKTTKWFHRNTVKIYPGCLRCVDFSVCKPDASVHQMWCLEAVIPLGVLSLWVRHW